MNIIKDSVIHVNEVGQFSDGSDREIVSNIIWNISIEDKGHKYQNIYDHDPTDLEISNDYNNGKFEDVTSDKELIAELQQKLAITAGALDYIIMFGLPT